MYSSKYAIPLEIDRSSYKGGKQKPQQTPGGVAESFNWSEVLRMLFQLVWSLVVGTIYFFISLWKDNPWLKSLPWFKMTVLFVFAYVLILRPTPPGPGPSGPTTKAIAGFFSSSEAAEVKTSASTEITPANESKAPKTKVDRSVAPANPEHLAKVAVKDFIKRFTPTAQQEMDKYGIPASIKMGQAIIESQSGNSVLAKESQNFFGIKCKSKCKSCTCRNYADDDPYDMFRVFDTPWESWRAHSELLCNPRYAKLPLYGKDYKKWAKGLKKAGYATDPSYDKKLIAVIEKYDLTRLDR